MTTPFLHRPRLKKIAFTIGGLVAIYAILGFIIAPYFLKSALTSRLSEALGRAVTIEGVAFNPFALSLLVKGLEVRELDNTPLLGFYELYVNLQSSSLLHRALTFDEIRLKLPYGVVKIHRDGTLNLAQLGSGLHSPEEATREPERGTDSVPARSVVPLIIDLLEIERGVVEFHDQTKPDPFRADIVPIHFTLRKFRTRQDSENTIDFTAELGPGEVLQWQGDLSVDPLRSDGRVALTGLKLRSIWEYVKDQVRVEITDGVINVNAPYHFELGQEPLQAAVRGGEVDISNFALRDKETLEDLITIPALSIAGIDVDVPRQVVIIDSLSSKDATIRGLFHRDGSVNYQHLLAFEGAAKSRPEPEAPGATTSQSQAWSVSVKETALENYALLFEDQRPGTSAQFRVHGATLRVHDLTTQPQMKAVLDLGFRFHDTGRVATRGSVLMSPLMADVDVDISQLPLDPFQPYVDQMSQVTLRNGHANLKGHVRYGRQPDRDSLLHYQGSAGITGFALVDKQAQDLLTWDDLTLKTLSLDVQPTRITMTEIVLRKPYAKVMIGADRSFNITEALKRPDSLIAEASDLEQSQGAINPAQDPMRIKIDTVRISDGSAQFADFSITPRVSTKIGELHGTIKGLSSKELARAEVNIQGTVDKYAPVRITGLINPLTSDAFTDLAVLFKNVELTSLSPYSAKYAGYPITKGKLSLDLKYNLSKKHLDAENKVLIDQLTLGEKTDSPDATSLPVKFALALVTDRNGQIDIDLPIKGNLNDPDFRYGRLVFQALGNLVTKAVTSPFSAIASLVGGKGEELSEVPFPPGTATFPSEKEGLFKSLAKALEERPGLRVDITGTADPGSDRLALAALKLRDDLKRLKLKEMEDGTKGRPAPSEVELTDTDEEHLLKALYGQKFGRQAVREVSDKAHAAATAGTLKEKLLATYEVDEPELRRLAEERAAQVREHFIRSNGVLPDQVFLLDAKLEPTGKSGLVSTKLALAPK
jgi:hypothetical protein